MTNSDNESGQSQEIANVSWITRENAITSPFGCQASAIKSWFFFGFLFFKIEKKNSNLNAGVAFKFLTSN